MTMRYVLLISYDGTDYHGWQFQQHCQSVSGRMREAFHDAFKRDAALLGASRTDAGVHALGQVAHVDADLDLDATVLMKAWNGRLPRDIIIRDLVKSTQDFHALKNVQEKVYHYHFFLERPLPFIARYGMVCKIPVEREKLEAALQVFVGTHDFRSFCTGDEQETTIRTIDSIELIYLKRFKTFRIEVRGKSFLRYMIRRIVGAALDCAMRPTQTVADIQFALEEKNPQQQLPTAPPEGLLLRKITYTTFTWDKRDDSI
jgi:tRNA pseudouridine38-40 synthase